MKRIVCDSNIFVADFLRRSGPFRLLLDEGARREAEIVVPEIVVTEVVDRYRRDVAAAANEIASGRRALLRMVELDLPAPVDVDVDAMTIEFEERLRAAIDGAGGRFVGYPQGSPERAVLRDLDGRRPFAEGRGWRDALIWETVLEELPGDDAVFVSSDGDFREREALHPDLVAEAEAVGGGELRFYKSLGAYMRAEIPAARAVAERVRGLVAGNEAFREAFFAAISDEVLATHSTQFEYLDLFDAPVDITGIEPVTAWPDRIEVITAQELPEGVFNVDFRAFVDVELDVYVFKYDAWGLEGDDAGKIRDFDHNESVARANLTVDVETMMSATFTDNPATIDRVFLDALTNA